MSWDRPDDENPPGDKTEGVRIIGAEEAAEALERGDVAHRRGEGELKYGDRPAPPPEDVRPAVRFPLSAEESDALTRPRVVGPPPATPPPAAPPPTGAPPPAAPPAAPLPHWTDPPTGEVPRIVPEGVDPADDDLDAWSSFATSGPRWRDQAGDWDDADWDDPASMAHDEETRVGALDESDRPGPDDFFSFDTVEEEPPALEEVPRRAAAPAAARAPRPARSRRTPAATSGGGRDMSSAVVTGVGLVAVALVLFWIGPGAAMVLVTAVVVLAAAELFGALQRGGYQPATLLGLVATGGLVLAAYWRGEAALPLVISLTVVFTLLWYLVGVTRTSPAMNAGVTLLAVAQVGLLGSFAALILTFPNGIGVLIGVVLATVANDVGALVVGQQVGRAPVAPGVSPNKTVEGVIGGGIASVVMSVLVLGMIGIHPWDTGSAAALGLAVAVFAPLGDLCESMIKRDLGIKDMSSVLPGHGGLLDRFDALLFTLPAVFYLCKLLEVH
jgi:phosphatidate cytidylyltransferase